MSKSTKVQTTLPGDEYKDLYTIMYHTGMVEDQVITLPKFTRDALMSFIKCYMENTVYVPTPEVVESIKKSKQ